MLLRLLTAVILVPFGVFIIYFNLLNGFLVFLVMVLISIVIAYEMTIMAAKRGYKLYVSIISSAITLSAVSFYLYGLGIYDFGYFFIIQTTLLILFVLLLLVLESITGSFDNALENISLSVFTYIILGIFSPIIGLIKMMDLSGWMLSILVIIAWITDAGGLFIGKYFGKNKIKLISSPNKTIEGYLGAVLFGIIASVIIFFIQKIFVLSTRFTIIEMAALSLATILASLIGDLGESTIKRWARTKDSGDILPGHGGLFDRFDSLIFSAPVFYVLLKFFGY